MTKVAIYHRRATWTQGSPVEQSHLCSELAERENWTVVTTYHDMGSGLRGPDERPGLRALLENARAGKFDTVLAEDLSRFGRDAVQLLTVLEKMWSLNIRVWTVHDGELYNKSPNTFIAVLHHMFGLSAAYHRSALAKHAAAGRRRK
jgi:site-specific DNA recombinase